MSEDLRTVEKPGRTEYRDQKKRSDRIFQN